MDTHVTLAGNLADDPELRFTPAGTAVGGFTLVLNPRRKDGDQWVDGDPEFYDVTCWKGLAENVCESLTKGARVLVSGRLSFSTWETPEGQKRSKIQVTADEVGPSLRWATCEVTKVRRERPAPAQTYEPGAEPF